MTRLLVCVMFDFHKDIWAVVHLKDIVKRGKKNLLKLKICGDLLIIKSTL